jgi:hypothetical protein
VGFLIVQDIAVVIAMMSMSSLDMGAGGGGLAATLGMIALKLAVALPLAAARWVVSTLPEADINRALIAALREQGYGGRVAVAAHSEDDASVLRKSGADLVFHPYSDAADYAAGTLAAETLAAETLQNRLQEKPT